MDQPIADDKYSDANVSASELVRRRPASFVRNTDATGLHEMLWAVVESRLTGQTKDDQHITILLHANGSASVAELGPAAFHEDEGGKYLDAALTTLGPSRLVFGNPTVYRGVPHSSLAVVNALSSRFLVEVSYNGNHWSREYEKGKPRAVVSNYLTLSDAGTVITFWPDSVIFGSAQFRRDLLLDAVREVCYLNANLTVRIIDANSPSEATAIVHSGDGLSAYVRTLNAGKHILHEPISISAAVGGSKVDVAFQYTDSIEEHVLSYANYYRTERGGTHVAGFEAGLIDTFDRLARHSDFEATRRLNSKMVHQGLTAVISVWLDEPWFTRSTLTVLANVETRDLVYDAVTEGLASHFTSTPEDLRRLYTKVSAAD